MMYYRGEIASGPPDGIQPLIGADVEGVEERDRLYTFKVVFRGGTAWVLGVHTKDERNEWVMAIKHPGLVGAGAVGSASAAAPYPMPAPPPARKLPVGAVPTALVAAAGKPGSAAQPGAGGAAASRTQTPSASRQHSRAPSRGAGLSRLSSNSSLASLSSSSAAAASAQPAPSGDRWSLFKALFGSSSSAAPAPAPEPPPAEAEAQPPRYRPEPLGPDKLQLELFVDKWVALQHCMPAPFFAPYPRCSDQWPPGVPPFCPHLTEHGDAL